MNPLAPLLLLLAGLFIAQPASAEVELAFVGDIMLDDGPGQLIRQGGDPLAAFAPLLATADYRIGNLECPIATSGQAPANKIYTFRAHPRTISVLKAHFDAVSLANNHSGDFGQTAFMETIQHLDHAGIAHFGGGKNLDAAHAPLWLTRQGLRIALLAYNEFKPRAFEAGPTWPGIAWSEDEQVITDIRNARLAGADIIIPYMHWGWERERHASARQRELAHKMIEAGAAIVIGSHPHVTQETEIYQGKPIIYSLGNFVFDGFDYPAGREGWLLQVKLDPDGVHSWSIITARLDRQGSPHPDFEQAAPCGSRESAQITLCRPSRPKSGTKPSTHQP